MKVECMEGWKGEGGHGDITVLIRSVVSQSRSSFREDQSYHCVLNLASARKKLLAKLRFVSSAYDILDY